MTDPSRFDEAVTVRLRRDEAIVLYGFLSREIWNNDEVHLKALYQDAAETHGLQALLQELVPMLVDTGGPDGADIREAAASNLVARHT